MCMDYLRSPSTVPVVSLLLVHYVAESHGGAACDSPYINNGRPVDIPEETYAKYCCKAEKYSSGWTSTSRFDCAAEGGCCGDADKQYCCGLDKFALQLGLGLTAGALVLLAIIAVILYCCVKCVLSINGQEIYCYKCCRCKVRDKGFNEYWINLNRSRALAGATSQDAYMVPPRSSIPSIHELDTEPGLITPMAPTAPPTYVPDVALDAPPPAYSDVIRNPHIFPRTDAVDATTSV
ncbi:uncharacterized protein LOC125371562 isoform X1 [Haliotis rufescens]|uniref:uncharacterized protein LOC125371562 isoform X1 n=1 Tax=Haliotis rufescens TaxID=6454 RepID=UPI00201F79DC|nr:uncharacterized protein LOC125371562 isoform X1 [Haliotis rufescens]